MPGHRSDRVAAQPRAHHQPVGQIYDFPDNDGVVRGVAYTAWGSGTSVWLCGSGRTSREVTIGWMVLFHDPTVWRSPVEPEPR